MSKYVNLKLDEPETLSIPERVLELVVIVALLLLFSFFVYHLQSDSGFYTEKFGVIEMICLYGPILVALIAPIIRLRTGHRQPARPFEMITNLFLGIGALWLEIVFPFNFAHLADTLPTALQPLLGWITNDIGRIVLALAVFFAFISVIVTWWRFLSYRRQELTHAS